MPRSNKRVSHPIQYRRDMDYIMGARDKQGRKLMQANKLRMTKEMKKEPIGPSQSLDELSKRTNKFKSFYKVSGNTDAKER